ncbi:MAG: GGDEF domain-containing protein [Eggerthellaceae bacterium]|nr:GGDEF domain-containing protein [Eggerthellaceae bacterium]
MNFEFLVCYMIVDVFCAVLTFIIAANLRSDSGSEMQVRYFRYLIIAYMVFVVSDMIWAFIMFSGMGAEGRVLPAIFDGINKVAVAFTAYFWFCYGESRYESAIVYNRRLRYLAAIPVMLVVPLYVFGFVTDLNVVMVDGRHVNGPTSVFITLIGLLYLVAATAHALVLFVREKAPTRRRMYLTFVSFMVAPAAGAIVEMFVPNIPVMAPAMMVSVMLVFMSLQESRISSDALTGLNNRRRADEYLENCLSRASEERPLYVLMIDLNRFKAINDTYGHLEGDHALKLVAEALRKSSSELDAFAARWGSDEFVMICTHDLDSDPIRAVGIVRARLADEVRASSIEYNLTCSVGYAKCTDSSTDINELVTSVDQSLYDDKRVNRSPIR